MINSIPTPLDPDIYGDSYISGGKTIKVSEIKAKYENEAIKIINVGDYNFEFWYDPTNKNVKNQAILKITKNGKILLEEKIFLKNGFNYGFFDDGKILFLKTIKETKEKRLGKNDGQDEEEGNGDNKRTITRKEETICIYEIKNGEFNLIKKGSNNSENNDVNKLINGEVISLENGEIQIYLAMDDKGNISYIANNLETKKLDDGIFIINNLLFKFENGKLYTLDIKKYNYNQKNNQISVLSDCEIIKINDNKEFLKYIISEIKVFEFINTFNKDFHNIIFVLESIYGAGSGTWRFSKAKYKGNKENGNNENGNNENGDEKIGNNKKLDLEIGETTDNSSRIIIGILKGENTGNNRENRKPRRIRIIN